MENTGSARSAAPAGRLTAKGAATRGRIVAAATDLIARYGVAGTSNEQVRAAAGVSGSQLSHYFDSKQALVRAVIARQADVVAQDSSLQRGALNNFEALRAWAEVTLERQQATNGRQCNLPTLAGELAGTDRTADQELILAFDRWKEALRSGLESMQERGVLAANADLDELSEVLLTALHGGSQLTATLGRVEPLRAALRGALHYVESFATETSAPSTPWNPMVGNVSRSGPTTLSPESLARRPQGPSELREWRGHGSATDPVQLGRQ